MKSRKRKTYDRQAKSGVKGSTKGKGLIVGDINRHVGLWSVQEACAKLKLQCRDFFAFFKRMFRSL